MHPYLAQDDLRAYGVRHGIETLAWSPIAQGRVLDDPVLVQVGERHVGPARRSRCGGHIQRGDIVFPKSVTRSRGEENFDIFDFELTDEETGEIPRLDRGERIGPDPDTFNWIP